MGVTRAGLGGADEPDDDVDPLRLTNDATGAAKAAKEGNDAVDDGKLAGNLVEASVEAGE